MEGELRMLEAIGKAADDIGQGWIDRKRAKSVQMLCGRLKEERVRYWQEENARNAY